MEAAVYLDNPAPYQRADIGHYAAKTQERDSKGLRQGDCVHTRYRNLIDKSPLSLPVRLICLSTICQSQQTADSQRTKR